MTDIAIKVENLSKRYRIGLKEELPDTFAGAMISWLKMPVTNFRQLRRLSHFSRNGHEPDDVIWALKNVSFEVKKGEVVGIIGRNGAGKSTLLKILSRITDMTSGRVILDGRVASLLEVGTGFHPELTGRENVYLNGTVLGMSKKEIDRKFDEIVDFSGVEKFIDTPVKRYSSGMQVRLAFSVAAHLEPEILLVDEVLAVGDAEFQKRCLGRMEEVAREGRTVLFVSHNLSAVTNLCSCSYLLNSGQLRASGPTDAIISTYLRDLNTANSRELKQRKDRRGDGSVRFCSISIFDEENNRTEILQSAKETTFLLQYESCDARILTEVWIDIHIRDQFGQLLFTLSTLHTNSNFRDLPPVGFVCCRVPLLPLVAGVYRVSLWCKVNGRLVDTIQDATQFSVIGGDFYGTGKTPDMRHHGYFLVDYEWYQGKTQNTIDN